MYLKKEKKKKKKEDSINEEVIRVYSLTGSKPPILFQYIADQVKLN